MDMRDESERLSRQLTELRPQDRQFLIAKLAEILVLDYQANQPVVQPTVKTGGRLDRKLETAEQLGKHG
jgi:hypothetical protein